MTQFNQGHQKVSGRQVNIRGSLHNNSRTDMDELGIDISSLLQKIQLGVSKPTRNTPQENLAELREKLNQFTSKVDTQFDQSDQQVSGGQINIGTGVTKEQKNTIDLLIQELQLALDAKDTKKSLKLLESLEDKVNRIIGIL